MKASQVAVIEEKQALDQKINALQTYLISGVAQSSIDDEDVKLLQEQLQTMNKLSNILFQRIDRFQL